DAIRVVSGDGQAGIVAQPLAEPLVVRVVDRAGRPVAGREVGFTATAGGQVAPSSTRSGADGLVRAFWTLGTSTADSQRVHVALVDAGADVSATLRASPRPDVAARAALASDSACAGTVGMPLSDSVAVRVTDRHGNPVPGAPVVWRVLAGGGAISPETGTTGSGGVARALWTLGPRMDGTQVAEAVAGLTMRAEFAATAGVGFGARLVKVSGDGQSGEVGTTLAEPVRVRLQLADGRGVVGAQVAWTAADSGAFSPAVSVTDAGGEAAAEWTLGSPFGMVSGSAAVAGTEPAALTARAVQVPRKVAALHEWENTHTARLLVGAAHSVLEDRPGIVASDRYGRPIAGIEVTWRVSAGNIASATVPTDHAGVSSVEWTMGAAGDATAEAMIGSAVAASIPGYAVSRLYAGPENGRLAPGGSPLEVSVETRDISHSWSPVAGAVVHWTVLSGGGSVTPASRTRGTDRHPQGTVSAAFAQWTLGPAGPQTLRATLGNLQVTLTATAGTHGTPALLTRVPGRILDAARDRVLWLDTVGARSVKLRHLAGGTDVAVLPNLTGNLELAHLFSAGALVSVRAGADSSELYEWRNGALARLGAVSPGGARAKGEWAAWSRGAAYRRDLAAGSTIPIPLGGVSDVGPNGDVIWGLARYRGGQVTVLPFHDGIMLSTFVTDGVNVAGWQPGSLYGSELWLIPGDASTPNDARRLIWISPKTWGLSPYAAIYRLNGGWIGFSSVYTGYAGSGGLYRAARHPRDLTPNTFPSSMVDEIAPTGDMVYRTPTHRYLDVPGGEVYDLGPASAGEWVIWRNGAFLLVTPDGSLYELRR
ncbi:MAG TPA: Ig-like domain-containing protein, partial [Longimicrobium sp.]|nr:Ig-like domain-containing protein [Longimicrobium sp.]